MTSVKSVCILRCSQVEPTWKPEEEDMEPKKKKKEDKAKAKELKKLKAVQKAEAAKLQAHKISNGPKKSGRKHPRSGAEEENPEDYVDPDTPFGNKKELSYCMAKQYNPSVVEKGWYAWWEKSGFFQADASSSKPSFVIVLPPPNVTGALHIGHALTAAIQDVVIRYHKMSGYNTLWVPGMDHAGIATQVVVEKKLMREKGKTRHDMLREEFVSEVWKWKEEYGSTILKQERRLGASLDWSRECFTMDEKRSKAVTEAFVRLKKEGLIYRDDRLVNWDCTLQTAVSDIEVDHREIKGGTMLNIPGYKDQVEFGVLSYFAYPLEDGPGEIVVATTRIETMLGDTAIAIHPTDKRYTHLHGKCAVHPFNGRTLPIICDAILVDKDVGTGAVKITPAHDPKDFDVGRRHKNLNSINIFTDDGKINQKGGPLFEGMPRFEARVAVTRALQEKGLYRGAEKKNMNLGICSRSNDVVEPMIKPQWFVNCDSMATQALDAVKNKKIEIIPEQYEAEWERWLKNIRDWCISRQLWWGHRVPAWYVTLEDDQIKEFGSNNDRWVVGRNEDEALIEARKMFAGKIIHIDQDPDVLDTWFSSGLFPLSVLGWPDDTADFKAFYPTSFLETGHDILFFWVARMVMLGMKLGGDVPFKKVYLHPIIRDAHGRKMSKSLGNVIDPLEVINGISLEGLHKRLEEGNLDPRELTIAKKGQLEEFRDGIQECGADALRFTLITYTAQSDKINLDIKRVVGYRQWCNKLWNAVRFAMGKLGDNYAPPANLALESLPFSCKWILSILNRAISKIISAFESYDFSGAASAVYYWWQYELCDVFIEVIKPYFCSSPDFEYSKNASRDTLWVCLDNGLRMLHPFMPFVTEELWQRLPSEVGSCSGKESIMMSEYPRVVESWTDIEVEKVGEIILSAVKSLRSQRPQEDKNERRPAFARCKTNAIAGMIESHEFEISTLANLSCLKVLVLNENDAAPSKNDISFVNVELSVHLLLEVPLNIETEREKLLRERGEIQKKHENLNGKVNAPGYKKKAREEVQANDISKLTKLLQELERIEEAERKLDL